MEFQQQLIVRSTLLSRRPRDNSGLVALAGVLTLLFVSVSCWTQGERLYSLLAAVPDRVFQDGEYWRLLTALGVHGNMTHFLSNAVLFAFFSYLLYGYFGFLVYPFLMLLLGSLANYISLMTYASGGIRLVGASGLVYVMAGFWLIMYVFIERRFSMKKRLMRSVGVGLIVLMPTALQPSVSYRTHAIGVALGVAAGIACFLARKKEIREAEVIEFEETDEITIV
jgi:rhomboid protease GluP